MKFLVGHTTNIYAMMIVTNGNITIFRQLNFIATESRFLGGKFEGFLFLIDSKMINANKVCVLSIILFNRDFLYCNSFCFRNIHFVLFNYPISYFVIQFVTEILILFCLIIRCSEKEILISEWIHALLEKYYLFVSCLSVNNIKIFYF